MNGKLVAIGIICGSMLVMIYLWHNARRYNMELRSTEEGYLFQINSLKSEIKIQQEMVLKLRNEARNNENLFHKNQFNVESLKKELSSLEQEKNSLTAEMEKLRNEYKITEEKNSEYLKKLTKDSDTKINGSKDVVKNLKSQLEKIKKEYDELSKINNLPKTNIKTENEDIQNSEKKPSQSNSNDQNQKEQKPNSKKVDDDNKNKIDQQAENEVPQMEGKKPDSSEEKSIKGDKKSDGSSIKEFMKKEDRKSDDVNSKDLYRRNEKSEENSVRDFQRTGMKDFNKGMVLQNQQIKSPEKNLKPQANPPNDFDNDLGVNMKPKHQLKPPNPENHNIFPDKVANNEDNQNSKIRQFDKLKAAFGTTSASMDGGILKNKRMNLKTVLQPSEVKSSELPGASLVRQLSSRKLAAPPTVKSRTIKMAVLN